MIRNEKGLTYPVVLMVIVLFFLFFTNQIQMYLSEKQLHHHSKIILKQEYYMFSTFKKVETSLLSNSYILGTGQFVYRSGSAIYMIETAPNNMLKISITTKLSTSEEAVGIALYDKNLKKMVKWVEKN